MITLIFYILILLLSLFVFCLGVFFSFKIGKQPVQVIVGILITIFTSIAVLLVSIFIFNVVAIVTSGSVFNEEVTLTSNKPMDGMPRYTTPRGIVEETPNLEDVTVVNSAQFSVESLERDGILIFLLRNVSFEPISGYYSYCSYELQVTNLNPYPFLLSTDNITLLDENELSIEKIDGVGNEYDSIFGFTSQTVESVEAKRIYVTYDCKETVKKLNVRIVHDGENAETMYSNFSFDL